MFPLEEALRLFWLPGLSNVHGRTTAGLASWLRKGDYVFSSVASPTDFTLRVLKPDELMEAYAHECSRMSCAAFESYFSVSEYKQLPRSCGWTNITAYYGSFFAAHSILRMCGRICFQIDSAQKSALERVAMLFGMLPSAGLEGGFYIGDFDTKANEFRLRKTAASRNGSHGVLWETFCGELRRYSNEMMKVSSLYNDAAFYLSDIADSLCQDGLTGTWLSNVRNAINYQHEFGAWFPYRTLRVSRSDLLSIAQRWRQHPQTLKILCPGDKLSQHVATCTAITSVCHLMVNDMRATSGGRSFQTYGPLALAKLAAQAA